MADEPAWKATLITGAVSRRKQLEHEIRLMNMRSIELMAPEEREEFYRQRAAFFQEMDAHDDPEPNSESMTA